MFGEDGNGAAIKKNTKKNNIVEEMSLQFRVLKLE